jgi:hypothetical protein
MTRTPRCRRMNVHLVVGALALTFVGLACSNSSGTGGPAGGSGTSGHAGGGTAGAAGAAGGGITGTGGATDNSPAGLCKQLITTLCMRSNDCNVGDAGTVDVAQCSMLQDIAFGCDRATSTMFPPCLSDVKALSCAGLFSPANGLVLPGSCDVPLNIPPSDAQTKCATIVDVICDPAEVCNNVAPTQTQAFMTCESDGIQQIGCAFTVSVGASYNQCLNDLCATADGGTDGGTPDGGASAPASCKGVIM